MEKLATEDTIPEESWKLRSREPVDEVRMVKCMPVDMYVLPVLSLDRIFDIVSV